MIDSVYLPTQNKEGVVSSKHVEPAHYTVTYIKSGNVLVPIQTFYKETYHVEINIDGLKDDVLVCSNKYNFILIEQKLNCEYTKGRILNTIYIKKLK